MKKKADHHRILYVSGPKPSRCETCNTTLTSQYQAAVILAQDGHTAVVRCEKCAKKLQELGEPIYDSYFVV